MAVPEPSNELLQFGGEEGAVTFDEFLATQGGFYNQNASPPVFRGTKLPDNKQGPALAGGPEVDDTATADEMVNEFFAWTPQRLRQFQDKAYEAGLYGNIPRNKIRFGDYDEDTLQIWEMVVNRAAGFYANGKRYTPFQVLDMAVDSAKENGLDPESQIQKATTQLTNPDDLATVFNGVAQQTIGKKLDPSELQAMIQAYQATESSTQRAADADRLAGGGGTTTSAPNPSAFAQQQIMEDKPVDSTAHAAASAFDSVLRLIGAQGYS